MLTQQAQAELEVNEIGETGVDKSVWFNRCLPNTPSTLRTYNYENQFFPSTLILETLVAGLHDLLWYWLPP